MDPGLTIVLLGNTGVKSASGNTILGRPAFESRQTLTPVTRQISEATETVFGKQVSVVDTPGILGSERHIQAWCQDLRGSGRETLFLLVFSVGRFTREQGKVLVAAHRSSDLRTSTSVPQSVRLEEVRLVLLGPPGGGKSSSGNTILGSDQFESDPGFSRVSTESVSRSAGVGGRQVIVVDTPGFTAGSVSPKQLFEEILKSIKQASPGPHALVLVLRLGSISSADIALFKNLKQLLRGQALRYSMVLFTHGDQLGGQSIDDLIRSNSHVSELVSMCGRRFCVFENRRRIRQQVRTFLSKIDEMVSANGGQHYTEEMFRRAQRGRVYRVLACVWKTLEQHKYWFFGTLSVGLLLYAFRT
ncbi:GTPase IMAP family member 2 [Dissostichus eleginoides]|uniref:GTPase IMAP family member 8 n=1 Tax=Dissostichus eleginoides TaxID=100907 RepID=A0AAD9B379_DISEL|nr:GTPase IMAP family member 2 [Dissostichus eleginoides]